MARALLILAITLLVALSGNARAGQEKPSAESPNATTQDDDIRAVFNLLLAGQHEQAIKAVDEFFTRYPLGSETFSVGLPRPRASTVCSESTTRSSRTSRPSHSSRS
jgi:hypothetical protein